MSNIDKIITEQVLSWSNREFPLKSREDIPESWPVITISREYGAGGRSLAKAIGDRNGFKVWDKELLTAIAEEAGADERFMASLDERRRKMIDDMLAGSLMGFKHSNTHYFRSLQRVVHTIGAHGKGIIVGRGSNYILKSQKILRVRIVSPEKDRIAHIADQKGITIKEAEKLVNNKELDRSDFIMHFFKKNPGNPLDYDLVLNSSRLSVAQMADIVMMAYQKKTGKSALVPA